MYRRINFAQKHRSMGRNGWVATTAVELVEFETEGKFTASLSLVTSKGLAQPYGVDIPSATMTELAVFWLNHLEVSEKQAALQSLGVAPVTEGLTATDKQETEHNFIFLPDPIEVRCKV